MIHSLGGGHFCGGLCRRSPICLDGGARLQVLGSSVHPFHEACLSQGGDGGLRIAYARQLDQNAPAANPLDYGLRYPQGVHPVLDDSPGGLHRLSLEVLVSRQVRLEQHLHASLQVEPLVDSDVAVDPLFPQAKVDAGVGGYGHPNGQTGDRADENQQPNVALLHTGYLLMCPIGASGVA